MEEEAAWILLANGLINDSRSIQTPTHSLLCWLGRGEVFLLGSWIGTGAPVVDWSSMGHSRRTGPGVRTSGFQFWLCPSSRLTVG